VFAYVSFEKETILFAGFHKLIFMKYMKSTAKNKDKPIEFFIKYN
jgi:hypothetical protein